MEPAGGRVEVDHVELEGAAVVAAPRVDANDGVLEVRRDDHLEDAGRVRNVAVKVLQQMALVVNNAAMTRGAIWRTTDSP